MADVAAGPIAYDVGDKVRRSREQVEGVGRARVHAHAEQIPKQQPERGRLVIRREHAEARGVHGEHPRGESVRVAPAGVGGALAGGQ